MAIFKFGRPSKKDGFWTVNINIAHLQAAKSAKPMIPRPSCQKP
jgi:hypothetical protein